MKLFKKLIAVSMTVTMAVAMAGCGGGASEGNDVEALLKKANETMSTVKSASMDMVMDYGMKMGEESMDMQMNSKIDVIDNDGIKMNMKMDMKMGDQSAGSTEMYAQQDGENMTTYTNVNGAWMKQTAPVGDFEQYNASESMKLYLENLSSFKAEGNEKVNDVDTTIVSGVLSGESMKEAMAASNLETMTQSMGMSEDDITAMLDSLGELPVKLWIAEDGHVMKIDMDMTSMMQTMIEKMLGENAPEEVKGLTITKTTISMTYSNFDAVEDFEIPAEALAAA